MTTHKGWWVLRAIVCYCIYKAWVQRQKWMRAYKQVKETGIPSPPLGKSLQATLLGHAYVSFLNFSTIYDWRTEMLQTTGKTIAWKPAIWNPFVQLSTVEPSVVKHVLKDNFNNYLKSERLKSVLQDLLGEGIFIVNHGKHAPDQGKAWFFQRKTASKVFTRNIFKHKVHDTFVRNTGRLCKRLDTHIKNNEAPDMQDAFFKFTMDTIGDIGFGVELDTLSKGFVPFADAFDKAQNGIPFRVFRPDFGIFNMLYKTEREISAAINTLNEFCFDIIKDRRNDSDLDKKGDILSLFLDADGTLSRDFLRDICMSFFIAGRDTTACTLSFTFLLLAQHPEAQRRLQEEVKATDLGSAFVLQDFAKMPYLNGVIMESLRLFPPVPIDGKQAVEADVLPNGFKIPAGTKITFNIYAMGRDPEFWTNPLKFDPDRWLNKNPSEFEFPVFQAGPRTCLGKDLAVYEAKFLTAELMKKYTFSLVEPLSEPVYQPGITMKVRNGLHLKVHPL